MPVEFEKYFEEEYAKLRQQAETYEELKRLIEVATCEATFRDAERGKLLNKCLNNLLQKELEGLSIHLKDKKTSKVDEVIEKLSDKIMELLANSECKNEAEVAKLTFALAQLIEARANEKVLLLIR